MFKETDIDDGVQPIPFDKSWMIRMGALDLRYGYDDMVDFLEEQDRLSDDLVALGEASEAWQDGLPIPVGESGTLYRSLIFAAWKLGIDKEFIIDGTLRDRQITDDPSIVNLTQPELLKLDNETSQWASAAVLAGDPERLDPKKYDLTGKLYKLGLTYEAVEHWQQRRVAGQLWTPRRDATIARQAAAFQKLLIGEKPVFIPQQSEDYCFAVGFGYITPQEGLRRWPSLRGHESDRIAEMSEAMDQASAGEMVSSRDHRVIQAVSMRGHLMGQEVEFDHPEAVDKSWPEFPEFLANVEQESAKLNL